MKHTKIKSFTAACLTVLTAIGCASFSAYAENEGFSGDHAIVDPDKYQEYLDSLTDEQLQLMEEKERMAAEIESALANRPYAVASNTYHDIPGSFTMYQQETEWLCVPACIKSVLMYVNGNSPTQAAIDWVIRENFSNIPSYINEQQNRCFYLYLKNPTSDELTSHIYSDVSRYKVPTFLRIVTRKPEWHYDTNGHCVLSNGISDDFLHIRIADPNGGLEPDLPYFYIGETSTVKNFTTTMCW